MSEKRDDDKIALTNMSAYILPYGVNHRECGVILLRQGEVLTTAGGARRVNEGAYDCVQRNLRDQLGLAANIVHASTAHLRGHRGGHELIAQCFITQDFTSVGKPETGYVLVRASLKEAVRWTLNGRYGDDAATIQILALYTALLAEDKIAPFRF